MALLTGFRNTREQAEVRLAVPQALWRAGTHTLHSVTALPSPGSRLGTQQALATPASVATQAQPRSTKYWENQPCIYSSCLQLESGTKGGWPELAWTLARDWHMPAWAQQQPQPGATGPKCVRRCVGRVAHLCHSKGPVRQFCLVSRTPQAPQSIFQDAFSAEKAQWHCQHRNPGHSASDSSVTAPMTSATATALWDSPTGTPPSMFLL